MTEPNLSASAESPDQCEIPAPAISQSDDVVQRARQALDGSWEGEFRPFQLVTDLLGLVEVALPSALAQRDDALREVEKLRATVERVRDALGNHPRCDVHPDDLITCGWKRAVADVQAALDGEAQ